MDPAEIEIGRTYIGGKNDELRTVVQWGSTREYVCWAQTRKRLPLGGSMSTTCTSTASFAKWAKRPHPQKEEGARPPHIGDRHG